MQDREARILRVELDHELKREYQRFLQERNRGDRDSDGRPDRTAEETPEWACEPDLPYTTINAELAEETRLCAFRGLCVVRRDQRKCDAPPNVLRGLCELRGFFFVVISGRAGAARGR